jgi:hypothetical protein
MTASSTAVQESAESHVKQPNDGAFPVKALLETLGAIAGASALLSALMLYFGWVRTRVLYDYFGVPVDILKFGTTDYVLRSADVFFKPVIWSVLALAGLVGLLVGAAFLERRIANRSLRLMLRGTLAAAAAVGVIIGASGLVGDVDPSFAAISMCVSGALIVGQYVFYRRATDVRPPGITIVIGLVLSVAAMFWAVSIYANDIGKSLAQEVAAGWLPRPAAIVYSKTDLGIAGIRQPSSQRPPVTQSWPFTYSGYKVLAYANNRWFLIQQHWQPGSPTVILPDSDSLRVEVAGT